MERCSSCIGPRTLLISLRSEKHIPHIFYFNRNKQGLILEKYMHNIQVYMCNIRKVSSPLEFWLFFPLQVSSQHILVYMSCPCLCRKSQSPTCYFLCNCLPLVWYDESSKGCPQIVPKRQTTRQVQIGGKSLISLSRTPENKKDTLMGSVLLLLVGLC